MTTATTAAPERRPAAARPPGKDAPARKAAPSKAVTRAVTKAATKAATKAPATKAKAEGEAPARVTRHADDATRRAVAARVTALYAAGWSRRMLQEQPLLGGTPGQDRGVNFSRVQRAERGDVYAAEVAGWTALLDGIEKGELEPDRRPRAGGPGVAELRAKVAELEARVDALAELVGRSTK